MLLFARLKPSRSSPCSKEPVTLNTRPESRKCNVTRLLISYSASSPKIFIVLALFQPGSSVDPQTIFPFVATSSRCRCHHTCCHLTITNTKSLSQKKVIIQGTLQSITTQNTAAHPQKPCFTPPSSQRDHFHCP